MGNSSTTKAILTTLAYYDIFDYPLTKNEIKKHLPIHLSSKEFEKSLRSKKMQQVGDYFTLAGRENIVGKRLAREKISMRKLRKAKNLILLLQFIPTILYVGISGSLAMKNAKEEDDIDLFVITKPNALWLSRILVNTILFFNGNLRRFNKKHTKDTVCTNMWMDAERLQFDPQRQNIYTAHEIVQLLPLVNKNNIYREFVDANNWIKKIFPNIVIGNGNTKSYYRSNLFVMALEKVVEKIQFMYMRQHRTTETIRKGFVAFHPNDYTYQVLQKWKEQQKKWNID